MSQYEPSHSIHRNEQFREAHYTISGLYDADAARAFMAELGRAAYPFIATGKPWSALGVLTGFIPQGRETAIVIEESIKEAAENGMVRLALVKPPPIVSMQHRRVAGDANLQVFETKVEALQWMRS